ncbi:hypothetical protein [Humisphaera borealis]|uniref:Uncharacterized protein n=1 Tax=Humisphaera borealis TaxID=2807512 RepID=A0A7M2WTQ2_9BACT|nr:hypothetical protein [Humisphaera borealis]QOV87910.1 hypothetical protein IPV69_16750 [Humisphaera borealis]
MADERNIPGFPEMSTWPAHAIRPFQVIDADQWRCGGSYVSVVDATNECFDIGFDSALGRLFFGATHEREESTAWVRIGSELEVEIFTILELALSDSRWPWLSDVVARAKHWSGLPQPSPARLSP